MEARLGCRGPGRPAAACRAAYARPGQRVQRCQRRGRCRLTGGAPLAAAGRGPWGGPLGGSGPKIQGPC
eukprot:3357811-Lingulodinium_polyedra.AAC.1